MAGPYTLIPETPYKLLTDATTGTGGTLVLYGKNARLTIIAQGSGTISGGAITFEEAYYPNIPETGLDSPGAPYTGTWSSLQTVTGTTLTTGAQLIFHLTGSHWAVRPRVTTVISGGGSITMWAYGN